MKPLGIMNIWVLYVSDNECTDFFQMPGFTPGSVMGVAGSGGEKQPDRIMQ